MLLVFATLDTAADGLYLARRCRPDGVERAGLGDAH
jgi:hypothetical protein